MANRVTPPQPHVQYITGLFREINNGKLKMPAFQREFVWEKEQIIELMESVLKGFPIGSLLFWSVDAQKLRVQPSNINIFPDMEDEYPIKYILDGLQRLSALYGCFHRTKNTINELFMVAYDVIEERFFHYASMHDLTAAQVPLSKLFSPKDFIDVQNKMSQEENADILLEKSVELFSIFQEYQIPTVTIQGREVEEVVSIFERINHTGTRLESVDFIRALTWSEDFDLNDKLEQIASRLEMLGFRIPEDTLIKTLSITLGVTPTAAGMLSLKRYQATVLNTAVDTTLEVLVRGMDYLQKKLNIYSFDFIPYQGAFLVLYKYWLNLGNNPDADSLMARWFIATSVNESITSRPESYTISALAEVDKLLNGEPHNLATSISITDDRLCKRTFVKGSALSTAVVNLFALNRAKCWDTNRVIPPEYYTGSFNHKNYGWLLPKKIVETHTTLKYKCLANIVVIDQNAIDKTSIKDNEYFLNKVIENADNDELLNSQFIDSNGIEYLAAGQYSEFLANRSKIMVKYARTFVNATENTL